MKRNDVFKEIRPYFTSSEVGKLECAYNLSKLGHGYKDGQKRDDGSRYFEHPKIVMMIIFNLFMIKTDLKSLIAALLHDLREDVYLIIERMIRIMFGKIINKTVMFVTKDDDSKPVFFARLMCCNDWRAIVIKLADRIHNMSTLGNCTKEKQRKQVKETEEYYFKLCDYLETIIPKRFSFVPGIARNELRRLCNLYK